MANLKKVLSSLILLALCVYATWKSMQTLAIVATFLFLSSLYTHQVKRLLEIFFVLVKQTKQAKFGNLEVNLKDNPLKQTVLDNLSIEKEWIRVIVSDLTPTHISLLLAINKVGRFQFNYQMINTLRDLRDKGLIQHNDVTIAGSNTVWLTEIGNEVVNIIISATKAN